MDKEKQRTAQQNKALHKLFEMMAEKLNEAGWDMRKALDQSVDIPWSKNSVKEFIWKPIMKAQLGKASTTELTTKEIDQVFETIVRHFGEKFGLEVAFPSIEQLIDYEDNMTQSFPNRIWGIFYESLEVDSYLFWRFQIDNPFRKGESWEIGLNEKFLREAIKKGVHRFLMIVGQREIPMNVPSTKKLKEKDNAGEFELKPSMFQGSPAMKIYHFVVN